MEGWKRTYWTIWAANLVTGIGMMSFLPFFPSHVEALGVTDRHAVAAWAGVLYGAAPLSAAIMGPIWGSIGDRYGRRKMVLRSLFGIALFVGPMALARSPWQLLALRIGQGTFSGFVAPSATLVSVVAPPDRQGRVTGSLQTALAIGAIVGPALGGLALGSGLGLRGVFVGVSLAAAASALLVLRFAHEVPLRSAPSAPPIAPDGLPLVAPDAAPAVAAPVAAPVASTGLARALLSGVVDDLRLVLASRDLRAALWVVFAIQFGLGATNPLLELFVRDLGAAGASAHGWISTSLLFSALAAVHLPAMPLWGRYGDRAGHRHALTRSSAGSALGFALHALAPGLGLLLGARVLLGVASAGSTPCAYGLAAAAAPVERRGSAFGVLFAARTLAVAVSAVAGGFAARWLGIRGLFAGAGVLVAVACFALARARRSAPALLDGPS